MNNPTDDYFTFFSQLLGYAPFSVFSLFLLALARLMPIVSFAPFFGTKVPSPVKMGITLSLAVVFLPKIALTSQTLVDFNYTYMLLLAKEFLIGIFMAFLVSLPFFTAEAAGILIDFQRGSSSLQVADPSTQSQSSSLGVFYNYMMIVIFYTIGGPFLFYDAFLSSYDIIPADAWIHPTFFSFKQPLWVLIWTYVGKLFAIGIQLAAPSLLAILMTELFLGIANRLAPQVQIVFLGMSLKSLAGLALLCMAWLFIIQQMGKQSLLWLHQLQQVLPSFNQ